MNLETGGPFGDGNHPTTRQSLKALDFALQSIKDQSVVCEMAAFDIGTGSGVLAIAAVLLGVGRAWGLDTDPVLGNCMNRIAFFGKARSTIRRQRSYRLVPGSDRAIIRSSKKGMLGY